MNTSIIIPTFNTCALTVRCIESIYKHPPGSPYEIIVVDNHSVDGTLEELRRRFPEICTIRHDINQGFSRACNRGAGYATGRYLLFLNSDTEAQEGTFDALTHWLDSHPKTGIVGPKLMGADGSILQMSWVWNPLMEGEAIQQFFAPYAVRHSRLKKHLIRFLQRKSTTVPSICGACLMIRRDAFEQIQGFDEQFELYFEDSDLCLRCKESGWKIDFVAESRIIHHLGQSTRGSWNSTSLIYQQSHIAFYRKHAPGWSIPVLKIYLLLKWLRLKWAASRERQNHPAARVYCQAYFQMIFERNKVTLENGIQL